MELNKIQTIAFDADDTLWVNEPIFTNTRLKFEEILKSHIDANSLEDELYQTERKNLEIFGYGIKGFMLSMIESAIELTKGAITGQEIQQIIDLGKEMLVHPVEILPGVRKTIKALKEDYNILIITKGDLFDQENKIARSGLAHHFKWIEIITEKDEATYYEVLHKHQIDISTFLMVGNSLKSDVLPVCNLGGRAVHIPFHDTWQHEHLTENDLVNQKYLELKNIDELVNILS